MTERPAETYRFEGFGPKAIEWFVGLEEDNSKSYFEANRLIFEEQIRDPMLALLMEASTHYGGDVKLFRANRDVRFSKDKSPYKTSTYGVIRPESTEAALYASISAQGFYAASGYYQIANDQLDRLRSAVADDRTGQTVETMVAKARENGLTVEGESLKTAPKGYPKDHPRIELLRMKELISGAKLPPGESLFDRRVFDFAMATWKTAEPLNAWLDANVGATSSGMPNKYSG